MKSICPRTLQKEIIQELQLVDVRECYEFELYRMRHPELQNIPFSELEDRMQEFSKNKKQVLVCNNGVRSRSVAKYLEERGFQEVYYLEGGLVKWQQNRFPLLGKAPEIVSHSLSLNAGCQNAVKPQSLNFEF